MLLDKGRGNQKIYYEREINTLPLEICYLILLKNTIGHKYKICIYINIIYIIIYIYIYKIIEIKDNDNVKIKDNKNKTQIVHKNRLKSYRETK